MQRLFEESGRGRKVGERQRHGLDRQAAPLRGERDGDFQKDRRLPALRVHLYEALFKVAQLVVRLVTCHRACNLVAEGLEHAVARRERRALGHTHVRKVAQRDDERAQLCDALLRSELRCNSGTSSLLHARLSDGAWAYGGRHEAAVYSAQSAA